MQGVEPEQFLELIVVITIGFIVLDLIWGKDE